MRANTYLELSEGASHKFYEVTVEAERVVIHYGRIGTEGRSDNLASRAKRAWEAGAEFDGEELLGIAAQVYEIKTGRNLYETRPPRLAPTLQGDLEAWADVDTTQENARRIYPRLCKLFLDG